MSTISSLPPIDTTKQAPLDWRAHLPVHPAAELFPLMAEYDPAALKELAENIKVNGLSVPTVIWKDENDDKLFLLDGRNRLDAMALAGILGVDALGILFDVKTGFPVYLVELLSQKPCAKGGDPYEIALGLNVHRRHLNTEQKRDLIANVLKAKPEKSNNQIAKEVKANDKTVAKVRANLKSTSEIPKLDKTIGADGKARPVKVKKKPTPVPAPDETMNGAKPEVVVEAKPPAAKSSSAGDSTLFTFTAHVRELLRLTDKRKAERFAKTAVKAADLARLGQFLADLAGLVGTPPRDPNGHDGEPEPTEKPISIEAAPAHDAPTPMPATKAKPSKQPSISQRRKLDLDDLEVAIRQEQRRSVGIPGGISEWRRLDKARKRRAELLRAAEATRH